MIIPLQNYLVIEQEGNEEKMINGIIIPPKIMPEKQFEGTIVSVGPYVKDRDLKSGMKVAVNAYGAMIRRKEGKKEYVLIRDVDVIAILTGESADPNSRFTVDIDSHRG
jgi:co-chaperonin GroES (HSP10)